MSDPTSDKIAIIKLKQERAERQARQSSSSFRERGHENSRPWGYRHDDEKVENKLWVGNLDLRLTEHQLIKLFQTFGEVKHLDFLWHQHGPNRGEPRGFCFVEMKTHEDAKNAIEKGNGTMVMGRKMIVRFSKEAEGKGRQSRYTLEEEREKNLRASSASAKRMKVASTDYQIMQIESKLTSMLPNISQGVKDAHPFTSTIKPTAIPVPVGLFLPGESSMLPATESPPQQTSAPSSPSSPAASTPPPTTNSTSPVPQAVETENT